MQVCVQPPFPSAMTTDDLAAGRAEDLARVSAHHFVAHFCFADGHSIGIRGRNSTFKSKKSKSYSSEKKFFASRMQSISFTNHRVVCIRNVHNYFREKFFASGMQRISFTSPGGNPYK
jgi:hypothetical protein